MFVFHFPAHFISPRTCTALALCLSLLGVACQKRPVHAIPAVLAPTIQTQPQPAPSSQNPPGENTTSAPETAPANTPTLDAQKPKPKPRKPIAHKPTQPTQPPPTLTEAPKLEPVKPATPDNSVQITADIPRAAVQSQKQNTENLLRNSEGKLVHLSRTLSESEQGMLHQARNYIAQSNQALHGGDVERAYNLAVKASLLANELSK